MEFIFSQTFAWVFFSLLILLILAVDLFFFHKEAHEVSFKEAVIWSIIWIAVALAFCVGIYYFENKEKALQFLTGYLVEKALSVDNLFVFLAIFSYFSVPSKYEHTILFWGVLGALVMRGLFIFAGILLIQLFHFVIYIFGIVLILTGIKLGMQKDEEIHPEKNWTLKLLRKFMPITPDYVNGHFVVKQQGRYWATPLLVVLIVVESTDILFAIDSVPAILAISQDPFIVYTSNVFAIMGLRALYFALSGLMQAFQFLRYGLAVLLSYIGLKMILIDLIHVPIGLSLAIIAAILASSIVASMISTAKK